MHSALRWCITSSVQPNNRNNFVATVSAPDYYGSDGLELIKSGRIITQFLNEPPTNVALGGTHFVGPNDVWGWDFASGLRHFVITSSGLLEAPGIAGSYGIGAIDTNGTNLYDVNGQVFNASTGDLVGTIAAIGSFPPASAVLTDTSSGRTFFSTQYNGLVAVDSRTLAQVGNTQALNVNFPFINPPNRLQRWAASGLSLLSYNYETNGFDLVLLRTALLYPSPGPNPLPVVSSVAPSPVFGKGPNFFLTVNGSHFVRGATVQWNGSNRTTRWVSALKLVADIPASDIAAAGTAHIAVVKPGPGGGKSNYTVAKRSVIFEPLGAGEAHSECATSRVPENLGGKCVKVRRHT